MPGYKIDGNDAVVVYEATRAAVERARRGEGPTFIEAETYRIGAHSTSDDPTRYRDEREVELWRGRDPIQRLHALITKVAGWTEAEETALRKELLDEVNAALATNEAQPEPPATTLFEDVYAGRPWHIAEQAAHAAAAPQSL